MKKILRILLLMPMLVLVASCSNDDEPIELRSGTTEVTKSVTSFGELSELYQPIHSELLESLLSSKQSMTFGLRGWDEYRRQKDENGKFEFFDMTGWDGNECMMPDEIVFFEGKVWAPYSTFTLSSGPTLIGTAWNAYLKASRERISLYVGQDFKFNEEGRAVKFLGRDFTMVMFNRNKFCLVENWQGVQSSSTSGTFWVETYSFVEYERTADVAILEPGAIGFASNQEAAEYILEKCRDYFGDVINLNEIYAPDIIFHNPYIYIEDLEKYVAAGVRPAKY